MFSSDNGPVVDDGYKDEAVEKLGAHKPAGPLRGGKYSKFDGGTRVPMMARWPGHVKPDTQSAALISQVDLFASFATLTGEKPAAERRARQCGRVTRASRSGSKRPRLGRGACRALWA